jgi:H+/gluconate symporter-like permease
MWSPPLPSGVAGARRVHEGVVLELAVLVVTIGLADSLNPSTVGPALVIATGEGAVPRLIATSRFRLRLMISAPTLPLPPKRLRICVAAGSTLVG